MKYSSEMGGIKIPQVSVVFEVLRAKMGQNTEKCEKLKHKSKDLSPIASECSYFTKVATYGHGLTFWALRRGRKLRRVKN